MKDKYIKLKPLMKNRREYKTKEIIQLIDKIGINCNHNTLFFELVNSSFYKDSWEKLKQDPTNYYYDKFYQTGGLHEGGIQKFYYKNKEELIGIEYNIFDKLNNSTPLSIDLLKPILNLSAKNFNFKFGVTTRKGLENTDFEEHLNEFNYGVCSPIFRWPINKLAEGTLRPREYQKNVDPKKEEEYLLFTNILDRTIEYIKKWSQWGDTVATWKFLNRVDNIQIMPLLWGCVEGGLVDEGLFIVNKLIDTLDKIEEEELKGVVDLVYRRKMSCYLIKGALYLSSHKEEDIEKAYECFEEISGENYVNTLIRGNRVGITRVIEAMIEMYKIKPTKENKDQCIKLYTDTLYSLENYPHCTYPDGDGDENFNVSGDGWESLRERIIITYMLVKHVLS